MKKILASAVFCALFAVQSFALINVGVNGGYALVTMQETNDYINSMTLTIENDNIGSTNTKKYFKDGLYANLDISVGLLDILYVGPRVGLLYCFPGSTTTEGTLTVDLPFFTSPYIFSGSGKYTYTLDSLLIPLMAGFTSKMTVPGIDVAITLGGYAGYGIALVAETYKVEVTGSDPVSITVPYQGGNFVADGFLSLDFSVAPLTTFFISAGYKLARIPTVKTPGSYLSAGLGIDLPKDYALKDFAGKDVFIDYSGYNFGAGITVGF